MFIFVRVYCNIWIYFLLQGPLGLDGKPVSIGIRFRFKWAMEPVLTLFSFLRVYQVPKAARYARTAFNMFYSSIPNVLAQKCKHVVCQTLTRDMLFPEVEQEWFSSLYRFSILHCPSTHRNKGKPPYTPESHPSPPPETSLSSPDTTKLRRSPDPHGESLKSHYYCIPPFPFFPLLLWSVQQAPDT